MYVDDKFQIAMVPQGDSTNEPLYLLPEMCNRHGLITGATGTGKTVTLKTIAQSLSDAGVPTFMADVKGDVTGMAVAGEASEKLVERLAGIGVTNYDFHACPVRFWDIYAEGGMPVRTTVSEMGPILLARLMGLTEVQEGVLNIAFHVADDEGLLLLDLKDLRSMLVYLGEHAEEYKLAYGNVSSASIGAIQRSLLALEDAGGDLFFGEPALDIFDWIDTDSDGKGYVNILDATRLVQSPLIYSTFLLWMLSELYEMLPEVGDLDKPKMVFFFDEAHLLFKDAPKALLDKVEQIVKLIRSKGVGVFFISQSPSDIPASVLAQLSNRVQHALRAYTPAEQKIVRAAAESFRVNPNFDTAEAILELQTGEALISFLDASGMPEIVQRAQVIAPACSMDAAPEADVSYIASTSPLLTKYQNTIDRESAYELLLKAAGGTPLVNASTATATYEPVAVGDVAESEGAAEVEVIEASAESTMGATAAIDPAAQAEIERLRAEAEAAKAELEALRAAADKEAEKEAAKAEKEAEKAAERAAKEAEREAERARKEAEKEAERARKEAEREAERARKEAEKEAARVQKEIEKERAKLEKEAEKAAAQAQKEAERRQRQIESIGVSVARTAATTLTRNLMGILKKGL